MLSSVSCLPLVDTTTMYLVRFWYVLSSLTAWGNEEETSAAEPARCTLLPLQATLSESQKSSDVMHEASQPDSQLGGQQKREKQMIPLLTVLS